MELILLFDGRKKPYNVFVLKEKTVTCCQNSKTTLTLFLSGRLEILIMPAGAK